LRPRELPFDAPALPPDDERPLPLFVEFELLLRPPLTDFFDEELLPRPFSLRGAEEDLG
jgi:hypothetical protein